MTESEQLPADNTPEETPDDDAMPAETGADEVPPSESLEDQGGDA